MAVVVFSGFRKKRKVMLKNQNKKETAKAMKIALWAKHHPILGSQPKRLKLLDIKRYPDLVGRVNSQIENAVIQACFQAMLKDDNPTIYEFALLFGCSKKQALDLLQDENRRFYRLLDSFQRCQI